MTGLLRSLQKADLFVCDESESFLQSGFWGAFKARFGWEALAFHAEWDNGQGVGEVKPLLVLRRILFAGIALAYIPWGPELPASLLNCSDAVLELAKTLKTMLPKDTVFIRFDLPWHTQQVLPLPFKRASADIQPPDTVLLDLYQPMESLMEQMKPKWRYNGRLAIKKGVRVYQAEPDKINCFYELLKETSQRDGIAIHNLEYYQCLFDKSWYHAIKPDIRLYLAVHDKDCLGAIVTLFREGEAVYLYGASSDKKRNLMSSYALQLKAIEDAKAAGCLTYDLFGIPPTDETSHPMAGLYRFKTGFGGKIINRPGSWDYPCRNISYRIFSFAELSRKRIQTSKKKRIK